MRLTRHLHCLLVVGVLALISLIESYSLGPNQEVVVVEGDIYVSRSDIQLVHRARLRASRKRHLQLVDKDEYRRMLRMSTDAFYELVELVRPLIEKQFTDMRAPIPVEERLSITLNYLATGSSQRQASRGFRVGRSTVGEIIPETCHAIHQTLKKEFLMGRPRRAVTALAERLWPDAIIPYVVGQNITEDMLGHILQAMGHWEKLTCIRFVNRTTEKDYIEFEPGPCGCCSFVGRKGAGRQVVTLSKHCTVYGVVVHELGHVVGFWHEHSRPDRDRYISIIEENIMTGKLENFDKKSSFEIDSLGQPYDYYSVMHYRRKTFSRNGKNTVEPLESHVTRIGQRDALSPGDVLQARLLYGCPKPQCIEELTSMDGNFSTPNYPVKYFKDHTCVWILHVMPGERVTLQFPDFALEKSANCSFDYLELREGIDETGKLIGRLCGEGDPGVFRSSRSLRLTFVSDASISLRGFAARYFKYAIDVGSGRGDFGSGDGNDDMKVGAAGALSTLQYRARCSNTYSERKGHFSSPLLPVFFAGRTAECSWTIDGGQNASRIQLLLRPAVDTLEDADRCIGDVYQKVVATRRRHPRRAADFTTVRGRHSLPFDGDRHYAPVRYSCQVSRQLLLSTTMVMIQWASDVHQAFTLSYIIDYNECELGGATCQHECRNTMTSFTCHCQAGFRLHDNGWQCIRKTLEFSDTCGGQLSGERGKIRASTEPRNDCQWTIKQNKGYRTFLTFTKFDVPSTPRAGRNFSLTSSTNDSGANDDDVKVDTGVTHGNMTCDTNYVEILIGNEKTARGRYCGREPPPLLVTGSRRVTVRLHTHIVDGTTDGNLPYFSAKYVAYKDNSDRCFHRMKASGNVTSPGFPRHYPPHSMCVWRVSARSAHRVHVKFDIMDIEPTRLCHFDYLEVRNGKHRTSPLVGRYCGGHKPQDIYSSGRHLWLMFISDSDGSGGGFRAHLASESREHRTWRAVRPPPGVTRVKAKDIRRPRRQRRHLNG